MQDTTTIELPVTKKKVELRNWITGRQSDQLEAVMYDGVLVGADEAENIENIKIPAIKVLEQKNKKLEIYVVAVDDVKENCFDLVMNLPEEDTKFIVAQIEEIIKKKSK